MGIVKENIEDKFVWKIVQYDGDRIFKIRFGDTKIGFKKAIDTVKGYRTYTYKIFTSPVEWKEIK